jgi:hypothetical protein
MYACVQLIQMHVPTKSPILYFFKLARNRTCTNTRIHLYKILIRKRCVVQEDRLEVDSKFKTQNALIDTLHNEFIVLQRGTPPECVRLHVGF